MTTEVIIKASCPDDTEVVVSVSAEHEQVLENGAETVVYVYDNRTVVVREQPKRAQWDMNQKQAQ